MLGWTVQNYLSTHRIPFERIEHARTRTALQTARRTHVPKNRLVKTVVVNADEQITMVVLHADQRIDLERLRDFLEVESIKLVSERELHEHFPDCELGAVPPLGDVYQMPVVVSESVASEETLTFCAGTHTGLISMPYLYFRALIRPVVGNFATH